MNIALKNGQILYTTATTLAEVFAEFANGAYTQSKTSFVESAFEGFDEDGTELAEYLDGIENENPAWNFYLNLGESGYFFQSEKEAIEFWMADQNMTIVGAGQAVGDIADRLETALAQAGVDFSRDKSKLSDSEYFHTDNGCIAVRAHHNGASQGIPAFTIDARHGFFEETDIEEAVAFAKN